MNYRNSLKKNQEITNFLKFRSKKTDHHNLSDRSEFSIDKMVLQEICLGVA
jgi:hypothetical protein